MAASIPALVEPDVLRWARESIGLEAVAASRNLDLPDDRVAAWEAGEAQPTIAQLRRAAKLYRRSLGVFFLPAPPLGFDTLRDFRRRVGAAAGPWSPGLHATTAAPTFSASTSSNLPRSTRSRRRPPGDSNRSRGRRHAGGRRPGKPARVVSAAAAARRRHRVRAPQYLGRRAGDRRSARDGDDRRPGRNLGDARLSLYFDEVPVIVVNGADAVRGRLFTLLHEYAHLLLHTAGLCDTVTDLRATTPDRRIEDRCDAIAAAILMPADAVLARPEVVAREHDRTGWDYPSLAAAAPFGTSAEAMLRRLVTLGRVDIAFYRAHRDEFQARYEEDRARGGGGNWYRNAVRDRGKGYVRLVADAHRRRVIDSYTAATYLNAKVSQIPRVASAAAILEAV